VRVRAIRAESHEPTCLLYDVLVLLCGGGPQDARAAAAEVSIAQLKPIDRPVLPQVSRQRRNDLAHRFSRSRVSSAAKPSDLIGAAFRGASRVVGRAQRVHGRTHLPAHREIVPLRHG
jgi:hypothetical protein